VGLTLITLRHKPVWRDALRSTLTRSNVAHRPSSLKFMLFSCTEEEGQGQGKSSSSKNNKYNSVRPYSFLCEVNVKVCPQYDGTLVVTDTPLPSPVNILPNTWHVLVLHADCSPFECIRYVRERSFCIELVVECQ
jgi:hypothetical protein